MNPKEFISNDKQIFVDWIDNYNLCDGIDSYIRGKKTNPFQNVYDVKDIQSLGEFKAEKNLIKNSQDFSDFMSTQASASGWGDNVSVPSSFLRERKVNTANLDYLISTKYLKEKETLKVADYNSLKFNDQARGLLQKKDFVGFKKLYGDSFILGFITGGFYIGNVHIETTEETEKVELEEEMQEAFYTIGFSGEGGAEFQKKLKQNSSSPSFKMSVFIVGDGQDPKQISIDGVNQMIIDAGNLVKAGKKRLYAVISSYEYLADYISIVKGENNIKPVIPPNVTSQINSIFYRLFYAMNTIPEAKLFIEDLMEEDPEKMKMISDFESILTTSFNTIKGLSTEDVVEMSKNLDKSEKWNSIMNSKLVITDLEKLYQLLGLYTLFTPNDWIGINKLMEELNNDNESNTGHLDSENITNYYCKRISEYKYKYMEVISALILKKNGEIKYGGNKWKHPDIYIRELVKAIRLGRQVYFYTPNEKTSITNLIEELNHVCDNEKLPSPSQFISSWVERFRSISNVEIARQSVMLLEYVNKEDSSKIVWIKGSPTLKLFLNLLKSLYHLN